MIIDVVLTPTTYTVKKNTPFTGKLNAVLTNSMDGSLSSLNTGTLSGEDLYIQPYETSLNDFTNNELNSILPTDNTNISYIPQYDSNNPDSHLRFTSDGFSNNIPLGDISPLFSELDLSAARPVGYTLTVSDSGFVLSIKSNATPFGHGHRLICVQRLVSTDTGEIIVSGNSPVVCLTNHVYRDYIKEKGDSVPNAYPKSGDHTIWQIVVRESDTTVPSVPKQIDKNIDYYSGLWNTKKQISINENGCNSVTLYDGVVTDRMLYADASVDLVAFISANVVSETSVIPVELFIDSTTGLPIRTYYRGLRSTVGYHEGARILMQWIPEYNIQSLVAKLVRPPQVISNSKTFSSLVYGEGITKYSYSYNSNWSLPIDISIPISLTELPEGKSILKLRGISSTGDVQKYSSNYEILVDFTPPIAQIRLEGGFLKTKDTFAKLLIFGKDVYSYKYSLDNGVTWSDEMQASQTLILDSLPTGVIQLSVIGKDKAGNWQLFENATKCSWVVQTESPIAMFLSKPQPTTTSARATFMIGGLFVVSYSYSIDGLPWSSYYPVSVPLIISNLHSGTHTIKISGIDDVGNIQSIDSTINSYTWIIETYMPTAVLENLPTALSTSTQASFIVSGLEAVNYKYKIDNQLDWSSILPTSNTLDLNNLTEGPHTVQVVASNIDDTWQVVPTVYTWIVDSIPPVAQLTQLPDAITYGFKNFVFNVSDVDVFSYKFSIDNLPYSVEMSVNTPLSFSVLEYGTHTLYLLGRDLAGNWQRDPTTYTFKAQSSMPSSMITTNQMFNRVTTDAQVTFTISGTDVAYYKYKLGNSNWSIYLDVNVPIVVDLVLPEVYTLSVIGKSITGVEQVTPNVFTWKYVKPPVISNAFSNLPSIDLSQEYKFPIGFPISAPWEIIPPTVEGVSWSVSTLKSLSQSELDHKLSLMPTIDSPTPELKLFTKLISSDTDIPFESEINYCSLVFIPSIDYVDIYGVTRTLYLYSKRFVYSFKTVRTSLTTRSINFSTTRIANTSDLWITLPSTCTTISEYHIVSNPSNGVLSTITPEGMVRYSPKLGFIGYDSFTWYYVDDSGGISNVAYVVVSVE